MSKEREKDPLKVVNASGFPFQLRVADLVEKTASRHGWRVLAREHPWTDPETGKASFIDLALARDRESVRLIVECKRAQEGQWIFLLPKTAPPSTERTRCLATFNAKNGRKTTEWAECSFEPPSVESSFCVVRGTGEGDRPLLERLAALASRATESFGAQELAVERTGSFDIQTIYVPVIVSNAELFVCRFDPADIDITTGFLPPNGVSFETTSMVRFRKPLTTPIDLSGFEDVGSVNWAAGRTVFVVNATALPDCFRDLHFGGVLPDGPRWRFS